ncbi:MAG: hypothetical protein AAB622_03295, partial [Patescibacteria group bacterium]
ENSGFEFQYYDSNHGTVDKEVLVQIEKYRFDDALKTIFEKYISSLDQEINKAEPWKLTGAELKAFLEKAVGTIRTLAFNLFPFLPETAKKIEEQFKGPKIKSGSPLFPRLS